MRGSEGVLTSNRTDELAQSPLIGSMDVLVCLLLYELASFPLCEYLVQSVVDTLDEREKL